LNRFLSPKVLSEYVEALCEKNNYPDTLKQALLNQIKVLRQRYGDQIPKDDFLTLMAQQQNALKTGYRKEPVDILEFLISTEYLNLENTIRPKIKNTLIDIFGDYSHCYEVVLSGSVRAGKTYLACCAFAYHVYKLSCLYNPQTHYKLSPGSEMVFTMQSLNEAKAKRNHNEFRGMIDDSKYFKNHFPIQGNAKNYSMFPNNITIKPIAANNAAAMSENVFCAFIDEANFMQVIKGSAHQALDEEYYDQATKLYQTIKDRIQLQFKDFSTGEWPGKLYLASSANHTEDFIQNKKKEAKTSDHIYVMDYAYWEVVPGVNPSGKKFWVQMPSELEGGQILEKKPKIMTNDIIEVPIELKDQFDADLHAAIRNVAGRPISRESKFIPSYTLIENIENYNQYYYGNQIFTVQQVCLDDVVDVTSLLNLNFIRTINPFFTFHSHCDMAASYDSVGIAIGATVGMKITKEKETIDVKSKEKKVEIESTVPVYSIFGILRINPPQKGQIDMIKVEKLYLTIKEYLTNLRSFTTDRAYSVTLIQNLKRRGGIIANYQSIDRKPDAYIELKNCLMESRAWMPEHETFKEEIKHLMFDSEKNKVDHQKNFGKDVSDAVAGTIYALSKRKASYRKENKPMPLKDLKKMSGEDFNKKSRPKSGNRPRSNNRPNRWHKGR